MFYPLADEYNLSISPFLLLYDEFYGLTATLGGDGGEVGIARWQGTFEAIVVTVIVAVGGDYFTL